MGSGSNILRWSDGDDDDPDLATHYENLRKGADKRREVFERRLSVAERVEWSTIISRDKTHGDIYLPRQLIWRDPRADTHSLAKLLRGAGDSAFRLYFAALYASTPSGQRTPPPTIDSAIFESEWISASWYRGSASHAARRTAINTALGRLETLGLARKLTPGVGRRPATWHLIVPQPSPHDIALVVRRQFWGSGWHALLNAEETLLYLALSNEETGALDRRVRRRSLGLTDEVYTRAQVLLAACDLTRYRKVNAPGLATYSTPHHFETPPASLAPRADVTGIHAMKAIIKDSATTSVARAKERDSEIRWRQTSG